MASTSETGHAKNAANFKTLITYLISLTTKYAPSKPKIFVPALQAVSLSAETSLGNIKTAFPLYNQAVDDQEAAFKPLNKLVTRIVRAYKACVDNPAEAETAISLKKKITGKTISAKKLKKVAEAGKQTDSVSTSQQSYDNKVSNFELLVEVLGANPDYTPNETELKVVTLQALALDLRTKTEKVDLFLDPIINGRISRNNTLYGIDGVLNLVETIKDYVGSVFNSLSPQMKYINSLHFKGIKK